MNRLFATMKKTTTLAALAALATPAAAQVINPPPFISTYKAGPLPYVGGGPTARYYTALVQDIDGLPQDVLNYLGVANPYWGWNTDFNSQPELMSGQLWTHTGGPFGYAQLTGYDRGLAVIANAPGTNTLTIQFDARWRPVVDPLFGGPHPSGKDYWVVVVRKGPFGQFSIDGFDNASSGSPSYYPLSSWDNTYSNGYYTHNGIASDPLNYTKFIQLREHDISYASTAYQTTHFYVMLCTWSQSGPYIGVSIKDAVDVTVSTYGGTGPIITPNSVAP